MREDAGSRGSRKARRHETRGRARRSARDARKCAREETRSKGSRKVRRHTRQGDTREKGVERGDERSKGQRKGTSLDHILTLLTRTRSQNTISRPQTPALQTYPDPNQQLSHKIDTSARMTPK